MTTSSDTVTVDGQIEPAPPADPASPRSGRLRRGADGLRRLRDRIPRRWAYVGVLFVAAKVIFTLFGLMTLYAFDPFLADLPASEERTATEAGRAAYGLDRSLSLWFQWDSFIYHRMAAAPLDDTWQEFAFPLLYPLLARAVAVPLGGNIALALLLVSNVAFVFMLYYALRLGEELLGDEAAARRFTRYLVLMPAAFLFQAALTESLFLCLVLAAFYHAERGQWIRVGLFGYFLGLSRSVGFVIAVPLALVLLRQRRYRFGPRDLWGYLRTGWPLLLLPAGWLTFMAFCRWKGGDWFAYKKAQEQGWAIRVQNPFAVVEEGLTVADTTDYIRIWFAVAALGLVVLASWRHLRPAYLAYALLTILVPLSIGPPVYKSLVRYLVVVFPLALICARWARRASVDTLLTSGLAVLQGVLFVLWLTYWTHFII